MKEDQPLKFEILEAPTPNCRYPKTCQNKIIQNGFNRPLGLPPTRAKRLYLYQSNTLDKSSYTLATTPQSLRLEATSLSGSPTT